MDQFDLYQVEESGVIRTLSESNAVLLSRITVGFVKLTTH